MVSSKSTYNQRELTVYGQNRNDIVVQRRTKRDNHGCDSLLGYQVLDSCGPKGACCDVHDDCFARYGCDQSIWYTVYTVGNNIIPGVNAMISNSATNESYTK